MVDRAFAARVNSVRRRRAKALEPSEVTTRCGAYFAECLNLGSRGRVFTCDGA
jgi:hypothetical protein